MMVFRHTVGIGFCRIGKSIWSDADVPILRNMVEDATKVYDEKKAPRIMLLLGIVFALQGVFFWFLPEIIQ